MSEIYFTTETHFVHPFYDKNIVFTGALSAMTRSTAAKHVRELGGVIQGTISEKTDFLILGAKRKGISSKHRAAMRLEMAGHHIQIIQEEDFFWLLSMKE